MAERIDANGYFLTPDGREDIARSPDHARWQQTIHDAWVKGHGDKPIPTDYSIMVVEKGDCQWTIAEDAGADPAKTAYEINKQFKSNPDLILPDQVVFLPPSTKYSITVPKDGQSGEPHDNTDIFADQTFDHAATAGTGDGNYTQIKSDIHTYLDSVLALPDTLGSDGTPGLQTQALQNMLANPSWGGSTDEGTYGRHLVLTDYFSRPGLNNAQSVKDLEVKLGLASYNEHGEFTEKTADQFKQEILAKPPADVMVNGKVDDTLVNIRVQQKVDLQNDIKSTAQQLGIK
jgi:hypothetical protein